MKKLFTKFLTLCLFFVVALSANAQIDLTQYTKIADMDFTSATYPSDTEMTVSGTKSGITAYETGNKKQQDLYDVVTPEALAGLIQFQGVKGNKGWWIRSSKGGLYCYNATRSAAVVNLKKDYVVVFTCTQDANNVMSLTNADGNPDGNFTYTQDGKVYYCTMTADGYVGFCGKKSVGYITNIAVYAPGTVLVQPTAKITGVDGVNRVVTFTGVNVAYSTDNGTTWTSSTEKTVEVTVSETTTFLVKSVDGDQESDVTTITVEAGTEISLAVSTFSITKMAAGYEKTYSVVCDNKDVLLNPTAKLIYSFEPTGDAAAESDVEFNGTLNATAAGVYTITASCAGYTSTTLTIDNTKEYELAKTLDFTTIKAADLSANWTKVDSWTALPGSSSQWPAYVTTATQGYFYNFASETAASTDLFEGLDCEINAEGKTLKFFEGLGVMYPIYLLNADGTDASTAINSGNISIAGGTADHIGVYTFLNNYSKNGTKTNILTGDKPFALYRFSDLMTKVEIYAPKAVAPAEPLEAIFNWADSTTTLSGKNDRVFVVEGVTLTTTIGTNTNNAPAINRAGEVRFYANNAMKIAAPAGMKIGRVLFYAGAYENGAGAEKLTYNGAAISDVWTLDTPAETVELSATAKCSFKKIVVVCVAEGQTLPEYVPVSIANTLETAYTVAKAKELYAAGEDLKTKVYVKGFVTSVDPDGKFDADHGNLNYFIADVAGDTENDIQVYRGYGLDSVRFAAADELMAGDEVVVYGQLSY